MKEWRFLAAGAGGVFLGQLFGQAVRFLFNLVVARLLGIEALGVYALAVALVQVAETLATAGMDSAALRFMAMAGEDCAKARAAGGFAIKASFLLSLVVMLLFWLCSGAFSGWFGANPLMRLALVSYAAAIPFNVATSVFGHAMQGRRSLIPKVVAMQVLSPAFLLLFTFVANALVGGKAALLFPFALAACASFLWIRPRLAGLTGISLGDIAGARLSREVVRYSLPFMAVSLSAMVLHWLDLVLVGMLDGPAAAGLYQPAARTAGLLRAVLFSFAAAAAPLFAGLQGPERRAELEGAYRLVGRWIVMVSLPGFIYLLCLPDLVLSLFGPEFAMAVPALRFLAASAFIHAAFGVASTLLAMTGHARISFYNSVAAILLYLAFSLALIPSRGITGAAMASLLLFLFLSLLRLLQVRASLGINPFSAKLLKPLAAGGVSALGLWTLRPLLLELPIAAALGSGALVLLVPYGLLLLAFGLEDDERRIILRQFRQRDDAGGRRR